VNWRGGDPDREFVLVMGVSANTVSKAQASFLCSERVAAGRFVVPAAVLSGLPASSEWTGAGVPSVLAVATLPLATSAMFTAPGLDLGLFQYMNIQIKAVKYREGSPAWPAASWSRVESLERAGWSRERLDIARAFSDSIGSAAVMIVEGGLVVDEWGDAAGRFPVHSVLKSFLSALYGMSVQQGRISLDRSLAEIGIDDSPPSLTPAEKQAQVRHLLQMRSGVYHPSVGESPAMAAARPARGSHPPGTFWYYNGWDFSALATIFERETRTGMFEEIRRRIAEPLQMEDFRPQDGWPVHGPQSMHPAYMMRMTARDLARFGLLFLRQGQWRGQQIVPKEWIRESTASYSDTGEYGGYGYQWWVAVDGRHFPGMTADEGMYSAIGAYGQYIVVIPARDLVVVHRVNSDVTIREVDTLQFGRLLRMILEAKTTGLTKGDRAT
jgi:CubicO group peptidase (beta-lactamase class C family)